MGDESSMTEAVGGRQRSMGLHHMHLANSLVAPKSQSSGYADNRLLHQ
jgi:ABC-type uncharacterized transport system permease subunit